MLCALGIKRPGGGAFTLPGPHPPGLDTRALVPQLGKRESESWNQDADEPTEGVYPYFPTGPSPWTPGMDSQPRRGTLLRDADDFIAAGGRPV